jgi:hypothetical protein
MKCATKGCGNDNPKQFLELHLPRGLKPHCAIYDGQKTTYHIYRIFLCLKCHETTFVEIKSNMVI